MENGIRVGIIRYDDDSILVSIPADAAQLYRDEAGRDVHDALNEIWRKTKYLKHRPRVANIMGRVRKLIQKSEEIREANRIPANLLDIESR